MPSFLWTSVCIHCTSVRVDSWVIRNLQIRPGPRSVKQFVDFVLAPNPTEINLPVLYVTQILVNLVVRTSSYFVRQNTTVGQLESDLVARYSS